MHNNNSYVAKLRAGDGRMTPVRAILIEILTKSKRPLTAHELLMMLDKKGFRVNKTTVYRQLETLQVCNIIHAVNFTDRSKRYELVSEGDHHHHLVCLHCGRIEDVSFPTDLAEQEKTIWKNNKFKVLQHSLEFFGVCQSCLGSQPRK